MGRGRNNGSIDQSTKKPKVRKNKERGDWPLFQPHRIEENKELPILVSEGLLAEMKQMNPQNLMNILLPNNVNRDISSQFRKQRNPVLSAENTVSGSNNCQLTEAIQILPPELKEKIYKEFLTIKLRQRSDLGWDKVNEAITEALFCEHNEQIVKVLFCNKCRNYLRNGLCNMCHRNGVKHFLGYPVYDEDDYDEIFKKSYNTNWCGAVA